jgi:hypothetical protein
LLVEAGDELLHLRPLLVRDPQPVRELVQVAAREPEEVEELVLLVRVDEAGVREAVVEQPHRDHEDEAGERIVGGQSVADPEAQLANRLLVGVAHPPAVIAALGSSIVAVAFSATLRE